MRTRTALIAGAFALVLAGCGGGEESPGGAQPAPDAQQPAPDNGNQDDGAQGGANQDGGAQGGDAAGLPPRPQPGTCVDIPVPDDGLYTIYDAGTAVVTFEGGQLVLGEVNAAEGWAERVDDQDPDEVEIDFRRGANEVLDLEIEVDDGRVEAEICADDD